MRPGDDHPPAAGSGPAAAALRHVAGLAAGPPLPPALRVTVNFHPDRPAPGGTVLDALAAQGRYLSQFVTGTSAGGLTAVPGGDRWRWESALFAAAYDRAPPHDRPVYGALDHRSDPGGAAPRFGSAHLRLTAATRARTTFCHPDSHLGPIAFGTADRCDLVRRVAADDPLDAYVEAHVHGGVRLDRDVEAVVLDPAFRGTPVEDAAARLPCPVEWHAGFHLPVAALDRHREYRGAPAVALARVLAVGGLLTPPRDRRGGRPPRPAAREAGVAPARAVRPPAALTPVSARPAAPA